MKQNNYIKTIMLAIICSLSFSIFASPVLVSDSTEFATAFNNMKTTGGGVIELTADITIRLALNDVYELNSTAGNAIEINTGTHKIIASGPGGATGDNSPVLEIGDNMYVHGTATVLQAIARAKVRVAGGEVKTITTTAGAAALEANQGWVYVTGGKVSVEASAPTTAFAVWAGNFMSIVVSGGTIEAVGDNTRALRISDGTTTITNATVTADGNGAYALLSLGANNMTIGDNTTISTTSSNGTDAALVGGGATSRIIIPSTADNVTITSSNKYKLDNSAAAVLDLRGPLTITANPVSGSTLTYPNNNVVFTASGNESMALAGIYYSYSANPSTSDLNIVSGGSILAPSESTTIKASIGKNGTMDSEIFTFTYTVNDIPADAVINISNFADLQTAYTNSQTGTPRTTKLKLLANVVVNTAFTMTPSTSFPVEIDADGKLIQGGSSGSTHTATYGGSLTVTSTSNTGIFQIYGQTTTNITGGTYTLNGNGSILFANAGSGVNVNTTKVNLSDATFTVNGTTNAQSIVKFATSDGNLISAENCTFNLGIKAIAFNCVGPQYINIKNCTMNFSGNDAVSTAFQQAPTNAVDKSDLTVDGLNLNMTVGRVFVWGGNKKINTIIKDLSITGSPTLHTTGGTGTVRKFYDFRAFTPTASPVAGSYMTEQNVALSLEATAVSPVDAAGATIVYTTDGEDPTAVSSVYSDPIVVGVSTTIKAAALKDGFVGKPVTLNYIVSGTGNINPDKNGNIRILQTVVHHVIEIDRDAKRMQLIDLTGKLMMENTNSKSMNVSDIQSGIYLLNVESENSKLITFKVIKH